MATTTTSPPSQAQTTPSSSSTPITHSALPTSSNFSPSQATSSSPSPSPSPSQFKTPISLPTLPARYEIRQLTTEHAEWASAIQYHANIFRSPHKYGEIYRGRRTKTCLEGFKIAPDWFGYAIVTGDCWGIFDTEYVYKREESKTSGGKLYWTTLLSDLTWDGDIISGDDPEETYGSQLLLDAMDNPLVSIAISHDAAYHPPDSIMIPVLTGLATALPEVAHIYQVMDPIRKEQTKKAIEEGRCEVWEEKGRRLKRAGTATRSDYEGKGLMKTLNLWVLDWAEGRGFESVLGNSSNPGVGHVWIDLPSRIKDRNWHSKILGRVNVKDYEIEKDGKKIKPFANSGKEDSLWIEVVLDPKSRRTATLNGNGHA